jgi:hypothetical protein
MNQLAGEFEEHANVREDRQLPIEGIDAMGAGPVPILKA